MQNFQIWIPTEFGIGLIIKEAKSVKDAFLKLSKKDRMKNGWIIDEDDESITFNQILGIEEEIF